ncbi:hypothetical protein [Algoriphagus winogradskyi]|uniref:Lipocalin-like domain-containing protein n=1 Tax=Algoriphagus winogradskyi TaxID=237017 RepID=A0ABY1N8N1_9BACT|nr:hypothetical protein [Algoriphagus winogradskyi]SMP03421.1 hypothetical protein SAMN06265367_101174 [Algoriphagus winogradskyi]
MKTNLLPLLAIVLFIISCKDNDDVNPEVLTQSHWQKVIEYKTDDQSYDIIYSIEFKSDGEVYAEVFAKDMETGSVLGFLEYYNGNYQIVENKITVSLTEHYINMGGTMFSDKEGLSLQDQGNLSREFQLRNKNKELHTIMPLYASSLGIIYTRVEK